MSHVKQIKHIYVAGPYTNGDTVVNVRRAIEAANLLSESGYVPFVPHLTHFWHFLYPRPIEFWYAYDLEWLAKCDALLRLPGVSTGADREVERALELGLAVFIDINVLLGRG